MISILDLIIVFAYIVIVFFIAIISAKKQGAEGFLVNNRSTGLLLLVFSIVSTNVGAGFFLSVAAESYISGISFGISMIVISTATALTFAAISGIGKKVADEGKIHTIPELLAKRFKSPSTGLVAAIIVIGGYLFVTALQFVGIGAIGSVITSLDLNTIFLISGLVTIAYTAIGGLRSDIYADAISFVIMVVVLVIIVSQIGLSDHVDFSKLPASKLNIFAFGGVSFFVLSLLLAAISSFMFMELWQRIFAAESIKTARRAFLISALIQPLFIGTGIFLGLSASLLYKDANKSQAVFNLMIDFLPSGLLGLGLVSILAILMTTVNSLVVVGGITLFTDIIKPFLRNKNEKSQLIWLKIITVLFGLCALGMAFIFTDIVKLFLMGAFVMMPLCPTIMWSLFAKKLNARAAITSMLAGVFTTLVLLPLLPETAFGPGFLVSLLVLTINHFFHKYKMLKKEKEDVKNNI